MSASPQIVVLDGVPLNPGDLDWASLEEIGSSTVYENTAPAQVNERIAEAEVIFTNKVKIPATAFEAAPRLKMIGVLATGYDVIDLDAARAHGVTVCNVPGYSADFTAQSAIALLMELTHHIGAHDTAVREGQWQRSGYFSFWNYPMIELAGKTLVLVGTGRIGSKVGKVAQALDMRVLAAQLPGRPAREDDSFERLPLDEALAQADVISLHCPLTPQTRELLNAERLAHLQPHVLIVNNARGLLVDEAALAQALHEKRIAGYATDVLSSEPPSADNPLLSAPNCIVVPHLSWASIEARTRILTTSVQNLRGFLAGQPQNVVS